MPSIILPEILTTKLDNIHQLHIPTVCHSNGVEHLKRIIYIARRHLNQRCTDEINRAYIDILALYHWFFDKKTEQIKTELNKQIIQSNHILALQKHFNQDQYIQDTLQAIKETYLSEASVLQAIIVEEKILIFNQLDCVQTDFTNIEFFCVLALYFASMAITQMSETKNALNQVNKNEDTMIETWIAKVKDADDAILEAKIAIDSVKQQISIEPDDLSSIVQDFIKDQQREHMLRSHQKRYGDKHQKRIQKACQLFEKKHKPTNKPYKTALELVEPIQQYSKKLGVPLLKPSAAQDTIYGWLRQNGYVNSMIKIK